MRTFLTALALVAGVSLSACSFTGPTGQQVDEIYGYGPPNYAGINQAWVDFNGDGKPDAIFTGGKEQGSIKISGHLPDGQPFNYEATDVRAFDGQGFRAELEKIIAQQNAETVQAITPEIADFLDAAVQAATKIATGGAL